MYLLIFLNSSLNPDDNSESLFVVPDIDLIVELFDLDSSWMYFIDFKIESFFLVNVSDFSDMFSKEVEVLNMRSFIVFRFLENIDAFKVWSLNIFDVAVVSEFIKKIVFIIVANVSWMCDTD